MTAIEMARECGSLATKYAHIGQGIIAGHRDFEESVKGALAMHTMRQAEIDAKDAEIAELVEALSIALESFDEANQGLPPHERIIDFSVPVPSGTKITSLKESRALFAKHRPDAFAKSVDGVIEGQG